LAGDSLLTTRLAATPWLAGNTWLASSASHNVRPGSY